MIILGVNCGNKMWMTKLLITTTTATQDKMKKWPNQTKYASKNPKASKKKKMRVYVISGAGVSLIIFFSLLFLLQSSKRNKVKRLSK